MDNNNRYNKNFDYSKLKGRITEMYGTQEEFSKKISISNTSLSYKLNNLNFFTQPQICELSEILKIKEEKIPEYFFTNKV